MDLEDFYLVCYFCNVSVVLEKEGGAIEETDLIARGELNKNFYKKHKDARVREIYPTENGIGLVIYHRREVTNYEMGT